MPTGYHHLTYEKRCQIYTLKKRGDSIATIAKQLDVHRSSIYREIQRNSGQKGYRFKQAHEKAVSRRKQASKKPKKMTSNMMRIVNTLLSFQWSPEQISGRLKKHEFEETVSHETIYQYIWKDKLKGGVLYKNLRHNGKKYNKRRANKAGRGCIPNRVDIDERPKIVDLKCRVGDWEIDTIIGKGHRGAIVSMVDRGSKLTKLALVQEKTSQEVEKALTVALSPVHQHVLTITADNGKEFANHMNISSELEADFFFAKPYHSWERGLNEHTNGLVRQYFPKKTEFDQISQDDVIAVELLLNNRPRKVLNYMTPIEAFNQLTKQSKIVALQN